MHKALHLEESPHKCNVCNRSFNQRSNLKTHQLTHTDHKPYECSTCGKVFRRNCDLRRHTLTHTIGGDVPADPLDSNDGDPTNNDDDDMELEVDSPVHSPAARRRSVSSQGRAANDDTLDDEDIDEDHDEEIDDDEEHEIPRKKRHIEIEPKDDMDTSEVTHCHHNGGQSPYTMRPAQEYQLASMAKEHHLPPPPQQTISSAAASISAAEYTLGRASLSSGKKLPSTAAVIAAAAAVNAEPYMPMLHVRRDLHQKSTMMPLLNAPSSSNGKPMISDPGPLYAGSIPFRKRSHNGFIRDMTLSMASTSSFQNHLPATSHSINPLNLSGNHLHATKSLMEKVRAIQPPSSHPPAASTSTDNSKHAPMMPSSSSNSSSNNGKGSQSSNTSNHGSGGSSSAGSSAIIKNDTPSNVQSICSPVASSSVAIAQAPSVVIPQPQLVQPQPQAVPRRTGFSIEDIMRR